MAVFEYKPILKGDAQPLIQHLKEQYNDAKRNKDKEGMAYWGGAIRGVKDMLKVALKVVGDDIPPIFKRV
jgi:hypothetical protein